MKITLPNRFDDQVFEFLAQLHSPGIDTEQELLIDFSELRYVYPFPTLVLAVALRRVIFARHKNKLTTTFSGLGSQDAISYLKYFGFFKALNFNIGNSPNHDRGSSNYLPITIITRHELLTAAKDLPIQVEIDRHSDRLASVLFPGKTNEGAAMMLSYCFREIIRNSFEHGEIDRCVVMAQRWYDGSAEIAIADRGIGILKSLQSAHTVETAQEAIDLCIKPGITSGLSRATGSEWDNSGFGLYVASELGRRYGEFSLLSSSCLYSQTNGLNTFNSSEIKVDGTFVKLRINTSDGDYFPNILKAIVDEGEIIAKSIGGAVASASKMSKLKSTN